MCGIIVLNVNHKLFIAELFLNVNISIQLFFMLQGVRFQKAALWQASG